jgi:hypothetical protein
MNLQDRLRKAESALALSNSNVSYWQQATTENEETLKALQWQLAEEARQKGEDLVLAYVQLLGYEASNFRTSTSDKYFGKRKLQVSTMNPAMIPEDKRAERGLHPYLPFVQTTLVQGTGAYNVLLRAAELWEKTQ